MESDKDIIISKLQARISWLEWENLFFAVATLFFALVILYRAGWFW